MTRRARKTSSLAAIFVIGGGVAAFVIFGWPVNKLKFLTTRGTVVPGSPTVTKPTFAQTFTRLFPVI